SVADAGADTLSPSLRLVTARGRRGTKTRTRAVVAALSQTSSGNVQPWLSRSHEPIKSEPCSAKFRALILSEEPRLSLPRGVERTARSISDSSEHATAKPDARWMSGAVSWR